MINNEPKCKCIQYFSGDDCEIESQNIITIKKIGGTTVIIAVTIILSFYLFIIFMDIAKIFTRKKVNLKKKTIKKISK